MNRARHLFLAAVLVLALAAGLLLVSGWLTFEPFVDSDQPARDPGPGLPVQPGVPVGQTFVARHAGLSGIEFYLVPQNASLLTLALHLRGDPQSATDLVTASLELPPGASPGYYRFAFPPRGDSHGQYFYAFLEVPSQEENGDAAPEASVASAGGERYVDGAAYQAHQPLDAQTAFRLVYAPRDVVVDLLKAIPGWIGLLAVGALLFVVPGWAILAWLWPGRNLTWAESLGLSAGVSLALYPLLFLWTDLVGLHLGPLYAWLPASVGLLALIWRYRTWRPRAAWTAVQQWARSEGLWPDLALLILMALVVAVRFVAVRTLEAPMWADSYHHTMITQLLVDNKGLFDSWAPYAELDRFSYHFGFHSTAAVLKWLTGLSTTEVVIWQGQLLNALAILALYPLGLRVTRSRWGGVWAVLLAGLLSPMPMFYVNWGRFTQLAAQVILPAAVWLAWKAVELPRRSWSLVALAALTAGGLALTHYRVLIFYGVFVAALILVRLWRPQRRETLLRLGSMAAGAALLCLPWFGAILGANAARIFLQQATTAPAQAHPFTWEYNELGNLDFFLAPVLWLTVPLGLGVGLWRRQRGVLLVALWWFLLLIATNPAWLSLPGTGVITNFALFIAAYIPVGLLGSVLFVSLIQPAARRQWLLAAVTLAVVGLGLWGAKERLSDPNQAGNALVTRPDTRAAAWIRDNTPPDARFLVNSCDGYGGGIIIGADGGWWLPLLAGKQNTVPPQVYGSELKPGSQLPQQVQMLSRQVREHGLDDPSTLALFREQGVTHVYLGQKQGRVQCNEESAIEPGRLAASSAFDLLYHLDRVWVFGLKP